MSLEISWAVRPLLNFVYALQSSGVTDSALALAGQKTNELWERWQLTPTSATNDLLGLACQVDSLRQLAQRFQVRRWGSVTPSRTEELLGVWELAWREWQPQSPELATELRLRSDNLREQWFTRGPGLWQELGRLTSPAFLPESAVVAVLKPLRGGFGWTHLNTNLVGIEATLTDVVPGIPETVRLAWLLAQLQVDLPRFSEQIPPERLPSVAAAALLIPVLTAAAEVEWAPAPPQALSIALEHWALEHCFGTPLPADAASTLWAWWDTYLDSRPEWPVALGALNAMWH